MPKQRVWVIRTGSNYHHWWMMNDEWWMMNDGWWMMNDGWWMMDFCW
jgi:hypothetical protein